MFLSSQVYVAAQHHSTSTALPSTSILLEGSIPVTQPSTCLMSHRGGESMQHVVQVVALPHLVAGLGRRVLGWNTQNLLDLANPTAETRDPRKSL